MILTPEELGAILVEQRDRIAVLAAPEDTEAAIAAMHRRILARLAEVLNRKSLSSLIRVEAVDFAFRSRVCDFIKDTDTRATELLFDWRERLLETELLKTIRFNLWKNRQHLVPEVLIDVKRTVWEERKKFNPASCFIPWARGIARNKSLEANKYSRREESLETGDDKNREPAAPEPSSEDPETPNIPAAACLEILRFALEYEPHEVLAWLFHRYLGMKPAQIVEMVRDVPLKSAIEAIEKRVNERWPELGGLASVFGPLGRAASSFEEKFRGVHGAELAKEIGHWSDKVHIGVGGKIIQSGKRFLRLVCDSPPPPCAIITWLWLCLLDGMPRDLGRRADQELIPLVLEFHLRYGNRGLLTPEQTAWSTENLRDRIEPRRTLESYAATDFYDALKRWEARVSTVVETLAARERMLGYAWLTGALRRAKEKF